MALVALVSADGIVTGIAGTSYINKVETTRKYNPVTHPEVVIDGKIIPEYVTYTVDNQVSSTHLTGLTGHVGYRIDSIKGNATEIAIYTEYNDNDSYVVGTQLGLSIPITSTYSCTTHLMLGTGINGSDRFDEFGAKLGIEKRLSSNTSFITQLILRTRQYNIDNTPIEINNKSSHTVGLSIGLNFNL